MKEVTDPSLLKVLNKKEVTDPSILTQLEGGGASGAWEEPSILSRLAKGFGADVKGLLGPNPEDVVRGVHEREKLSLGERMKGSIPSASELVNYPIEHPLNTAMSLFPLGAGKLAQRVAKSTIPEKIMGNTLKMGLDPYVLAKEGMEAAVEKRMDSLRTSVEYETRRNVEGAIKAEQLEKETNASTNAIIKVATERGEPVDFVKLVDEGLKLAYEKADIVFPDQGKKIVDAFRNRILRVDKEGVPQRTSGTPEEANALKRELWDLSKFTGKAPTALSAELQGYMTKGVAHSIEAELEARYPALKTLNPEDAARINLRNRIYEIVQEKMEGKEKGPHAAAILHPTKLGWYASLQVGALGRLKEDVAFALNRVRQSAQRLTTPLTPQVLPGDPSAPIEGQVVPPKALPGISLPPGGLMPPSSRTPSPGGMPPLVRPPRALLEEKITRGTGYPPYFGNEPLAGEPSAMPRMESGVTPTPSSGRGPYGGPSPLVGMAPDRIEAALSKPAFMRTAEDKLVLQEAAKVRPETGKEDLGKYKFRDIYEMVTSPYDKFNVDSLFSKLLSQGFSREDIYGMSMDQGVGLVKDWKPQSPVTGVERGAVKNTVKFGTKGGVIGRPRVKTETSIKKAIAEESSRRKGRTVEPSK